MLIKAAIVSGAIIIGLLSTYVFKMGRDNAIEQLSEDIIKRQTGITIDLTPGDN